MKKIFKTNIKIKISIAFTLAFIAFIIVQQLSNESIKNLKESEKQILTARLFSNKITVISAISAHQDKIMSFILTGNKNFLVDNEENLRNATINLQDLHDFSLSGEQKMLVTRLDSLVNADIQFCQQLLIAYDKTNKADAIGLINTRKGEQIINEIVKTINHVRQLDDDKFTAIIRSNESYSNKVVFLNYTATAFAAIVILFSIFALYRYINQRILVEQELIIAHQKAQQSAIMKEQFMANMSHEIRTPMNAIIGFTNLVSKTQLDNTQKEHIKAIQTSGENLLNIINDILDFTKIEEGMVKIEKIPFSPVALLQSINIMFLPKANDKKIKLDFTTTTNLPQTVIGDPTRLTQILVNLINNALKFTSAGSIEVKTELLNEENENVNIQYQVKDTGIGIPKDKLSDIFERFMQASADTTRKYGGSGLGLSIVKKLVELQGGNIHVESAVGFGSCFIFTIPYKKTTALVYHSTLQPIPLVLKNKIKILVAEDNILNQLLAESLLTQWGFDYDIVENGNLAIDKLKQHDYDLVLMDIQMPEMNGYDTAQFIRQNLYLSLPIIAMTAHVFPGEKEKCLSYGITDYISKPIREIELYSLIARYISFVPGKEKPENTFQSLNDINNKVTNLDYVKELSNGNPAFVRQMIGLFLSENPKEIQQLEAVIQQKDFGSIRRVSHKMKSTIAYAGLDSQIKNELSEIEELALKDTSLPQIEILFSKVKKTCLKAIEELNNSINNLT